MFFDFDRIQSFLILILCSLSPLRNSNINQITLIQYFFTVFNSEYSRNLRCQPGILLAFRERYHFSIETKQISYSLVLIRQ